MDLACLFLLLLLWLSMYKVSGVGLRQSISRIRFSGLPGIVFVGK